MGNMTIIPSSDGVAYGAYPNGDAPSAGGTLLYSEYFENTTAAATDQSSLQGPTTTYPFQTGESVFWDQHRHTTYLIQGSCSGRTAYTGNNFFHVAFDTAHADPCIPDMTNAYGNPHLQFGNGLLTYPTSNQSTFDLESITTDVVVVRVPFRLTGDWSPTNDQIDAGAGLKFIRITGDGNQGDPSGILLKLRFDGDSEQYQYYNDQRWNIYEHSGETGPINHYFTTGVNLRDMAWHTCCFKAEILNKTNTRDNIRVSIWIDDWTMAGAADSTMDVYFSAFGTMFSQGELLSGWSAASPAVQMGMDIGALEIWDGDPS